MKYEPGHPEDQQAFVDARAPLNRDGDELVDDSPEDRPVHDTNDPETPHSLMEPDLPPCNLCLSISPCRADLIRFFSENCNRSSIRQHETGSVIFSICTQEHTMCISLDGTESRGLFDSV